jgi:hypothetical protein
MIMYVVRASRERAEYCALQGWMRDQCQRGGTVGGGRSLHRCLRRRTCLRKFVRLWRFRTPPTQGDEPSFRLGSVRNQRLSADVEASMQTVEMGHRLKGEVPGMKVSVLMKYGNRRFHTQDPSPPANHSRIQDFLTRAHS